MPEELPLVRCHEYELVWEPGGVGVWEAHCPTCERLIITEGPSVILRPEPRRVEVRPPERGSSPPAAADDALEITLWVPTNSRPTFVHVTVREG